MAIDALATAGAAAPVAVHVALIVLLAGANGVARLGSRFAVIGAGQRVEADLRNDLHAALLRYPPAFLARHSTGDIMARATSDVAAVKSLVGFGTVSLVSTSLAFVGAIAAMTAVDRWLALWALAPYPLLVVLAPSPAFAYIGPGAGFALAGSFFAVFTAVASAVFTLVTWPVRLAFRTLFGLRAMAKARVKRVVILGLDGMDHGLTEGMLDEGKLPHLAALRDKGCFRPLGSTVPPMRQPTSRASVPSDMRWLPRTRFLPGLRSRMSAQAPAPRLPESPATIRASYDQTVPLTAEASPITAPPWPETFDDDQDAPRKHVVVDGDSLSRLAARYLGDPHRVAEIYELNRGVLTNPDLLPIGAELTIPARRM